jgi:hypothetical protein
MSQPVKFGGLEMKYLANIWRRIKDAGAPYTAYEAIATNDWDVYC